jgi:hypothetical protein
MADLVNCGGGCDYDFNISTTSTVDASVDDGSYTSKNTAISFTTPNTEDDDLEYTFTVYAHSDHTFTDNCTGKMQFVAGSTCKQVTWTPSGTPSNTGGGSWSPGLNWKADCFDISTSGYVCSVNIQIKAEDCKGETLTWNQGSVTLKSDDGYKDGANPSPGETIHISANKECTISQFYLEGCVNYKPEISCAAISTSKVKNSAVIIKPTVTNCTNDLKCSYTITGGGTTINHSTKNWKSGDEMDQLALVNEVKQETYKLKVANVYAESDECTFTINYTSGTPAADVTVSSNGGHFNLSSGDRVILVNSGTNNPSKCDFRCYPVSGTIKMTVGSQSDGPNSGPYIGLPAATCKNGTKFTVNVTGDAKDCMIQW